MDIPVSSPLYCEGVSAADSVYCSGWLKTTVGDPGWLNAVDAPGVRMAQKFAQMLGQNASQAATLLDHDILGDYPNKDQISSLYNMAYHADKVCMVCSGQTPPHMTAARPLELFGLR